MIIYFNFDSLKIEIIQQRNNKKYFAVDFLMESYQKKDFAKIIDNLCKNKDIKIGLMTEKNYVILPDEVVGFDSLKVPTANFGSKKHFLTKFNLVFNANNNLVQNSNLYKSNKTDSTFVFCMTKRNIIDQIVQAFKKHSINISGISYFSKVFTNYLFSVNKHLSKEDFVAILPRENLSLYAISKGNVVGVKNIPYNQNNQKFAKEYANFVKNNSKKQILDSNSIENELLKSVKKDGFKTKKEAEILSQILAFKQYFKTSDLQIDLNKLYVINLENKNSVEFKQIDFHYIDAENIQNILSCYKQNIFFDSRKGILDE